MAQIYFLSIILNLIAGTVLIYGKSLYEEKKDREILQEQKDVPVIKGRRGRKTSPDESLDESNESESKSSLRGLASLARKFDSKTSRLVLAFSSAVVGVFKILSAFRNDVPVIGDLLPAAAGLLCGGALFLDFYCSQSTLENLPFQVRQVFIDRKKTIGVFSVIVAILHFVFPQVILL